MSYRQLHDDGNDGYPAPCCGHLCAHHVLGEDTGRVKILGGERQREEAEAEALHKHIGVEDNAQLDDRGGMTEGSCQLSEEVPHHIHGRGGREARPETACGLHGHRSLLRDLCYSRMSDEPLDRSTAPGWVEEGGLDRGKAEGQHKGPAGGIETEHKAGEHSLGDSLLRRAVQEHADVRDVREHGHGLESTAAEQPDSCSPAGESCRKALRVGLGTAAQCIRIAAASCDIRHGLRDSGRLDDCLMHHRDSGHTGPNSTARSWRRRRWEAEGEVVRNCTSTLFIGSCRKELERFWLLWKKVKQ